MSRTQFQICIQVLEHNSTNIIPAYHVQNTIPDMYSGFRTHTQNRFKIKYKQHRNIMNHKAKTIIITWFSMFQQVTGLTKDTKSQIKKQHNPDTSG